MRINHLFSLLLALPLVFAACEKSAPNEEPAPVVNPTVEVVAGEAGETSLRFTITTEQSEAAAWLVVEASEATPTASEVLQNGIAVECNKSVECEAQDLVAETEYKVVAASKNANGVALDEVTMTTTKQNTPGPEPDPTPDTDEFVPVKVVASLYESGNFMVKFYIDEYIFHELDMYDTIAPNEDYLSAGNYSFANGGVGEQWSKFYYYETVGESSSSYNCKFADVNLDLVINADNSVTITGTMSSVKEHHLNVNWTGVVEGFDFNGGNGDEPTPPAGDVNFTASNFYYEYWGNAETAAYNYYVVLSDVPMNGDKFSQNSTNYVFDLYSNVGASNENGVIPNGIYSLANTYGAGTFSQDYGFLARIYDEVEYVLYVDGFVTVSDNKIEAQLEMEDGTVHTVVYEGSLAWGNGGGNDTPSDFEATHTASKWLWGGISNYGNKYSVSGDGFAVDVHFPTQFAQQTSLATGSYIWTSTSFFGYNDFDNEFTTRSFSVNGGSVAVDAGSAVVSADGDVYHIELTLNGRDGFVYMIQYDGKLNDAGSGAEEFDGNLTFTSATLTDHNTSTGFYTYLLSNGTNASMELLVSDMSATASNISAGTYSYAPMLSIVGTQGYFYVRNFYVNDISYKPMVNASMEVESDGTNLNIVLTLPCDNGATINATFAGTIQ